MLAIANALSFGLNKDWMLRGRVGTTNGHAG